MLFAPDIDSEPNTKELFNPVTKTFVVGDISTLLSESVTACPDNVTFAFATCD